VRFIAEKTSIPVIASGGIDSVDAALEKLDAGAALLQLYTGFIYQGPALVQEICEAILRRSDR
jgi:dihydroorotate dehydrogenase